MLIGIVQKMRYSKSRALGDVVCTLSIVIITLLVDPLLDC